MKVVGDGVFVEIWIYPTTLQLFSIRFSRFAN